MQQRAAVQAAASLASVMGRCAADDLINQAKASFRAVQLCDLRFDVFSDQAPNEAHSKLSQPCVWGECDAFLTHSWSEDPLAKWAELQNWRSEFVAKHGREPSVWFDKCCIDQQNIDSELRCLPIFVAGCSRMVVLCGPTYLSRMWCVLELFISKCTGGTITEVLPVLRKGRETEDLAAVRGAFAAFDVRECNCADAGIKQRLLGLIETVYGSIHSFNEAARAFPDSL